MTDDSKRRVAWSADLQFDDTAQLDGRTYHVVKIDADGAVWWSRNLSGSPECCTPRLPPRDLHTGAHTTKVMDLLVPATNAEIAQGFLGRVNLSDHAQDATAHNFQNFTGKAGDVLRRIGDGDPDWTPISYDNAKSAMPSMKRTPIRADQQRQFFAPSIPVVVNYVSAYWAKRHEEIMLRELERLGSEIVTSMPASILPAKPLEPYSPSDSSSKLLEQLFSSGLFSQRKSDREAHARLIDSGITTKSFEEETSDLEKESP